MPPPAAICPKTVKCPTAQAAGHSFGWGKKEERFKRGFVVSKADSFVFPSPSVNIITPLFEQGVSDLKIKKYIFVNTPFLLTKAYNKR